MKLRRASSDPAGGTADAPRRGLSLRRNGKAESKPSAAQDLRSVWERLEKARAGLTARGLDVKLAPAKPAGLDTADDTQALRLATAALAAQAAELEHLLDIAARSGFRQTPTSDVALLQGLVTRMRNPANLQAEARVVAEVVDLWIADPKLRTYQTELIDPYAQGVKALAASARDHSSIEAARLAFGGVQRAQRASAAYLLRRNDALDKFQHVRPADLARLREPPAFALERMDAAIRQARSLGPVDFFQNLFLYAREVAQRPGAGAMAAWLLSDITVALLATPEVRHWLSEAGA